MRAPAPSTPADLRLFALVAPVALVASFLGARLAGRNGGRRVGPKLRWR